MANETSWQTVRLPWESLIEEAETKASWTAELERNIRCEVNEHVEDKLIDNEIIDTIFLHEEQGGRAHEDCMTRSKVG